MAGECDVSKIVTKFLLNTCRLLQSLTKHYVQAAVLCGLLAAVRPSDEEAQFIPLTTGSVAEFYIEPMLPSFGDIDLMHHYNTQLAIPQGHPPPTQLPAEFHNYVKVAEIIDSHLPGFVYLPIRYLLTQCIDDSKYNYVEYEETVYLSNGSYTDDMHGPALLTDSSHTSQLSVDTVLCVRCLSWPPQAADWPTRHRNYGWPDSATLDRVVSDGCDVVGVAHRQCRQHELMGKSQWRLSLSRAEIVLINSWMPVQQIVYHMLRYFMKTERLTDCADNSGAGTLSNYHIKTLMLWACELHPRSWWTVDLNLVRICVELLNTLSVWLTDTRCPHYFINNCNLLDNSFNVESVASKLVAIDEEYLSTWFVKNYIGKCAQLPPLCTLRLFNDISTSSKLQNAVSKIVCWRLNFSLFEVWRTVKLAEHSIPLQLSLHSLTVHSCVCWMNELTKIDQRLCLYFSANVLLHVACKISRIGFTNELMDILSTVLARNTYQCCSVLCLRKIAPNIPELVYLLQKSAVEHLTTYRQLVALDFGSVVTIVTTDFEAMYAYKRGDYQRCLQLSTQNVHTLLCPIILADVSAFPEFTQLLDDDIASLTALALIVNPKLRLSQCDFCITQSTMSLYLMALCQLKLPDSVTSLAQTLHYIQVAQRKHSLILTLDHLTLKLIERKLYRSIRH